MTITEHIEQRLRNIQADAMMLTQKKKSLVGQIAMIDEELAHLNMRLDSLGGAEGELRSLLADIKAAADEGGDKD